MPVYESKPTPEGYTGNSSKPFALIPEDTVLDAEVGAVKDDIKPFNKKDDKGNDTGIPVVKPTFTFLTSFDGQDRKVWGETWPEFYPHPDCQLWSWTKEILGVDNLDPDFVLDTDDLVGLKCRVTMGVRSYWSNKGLPPKEDGTPAEKTERFVNFVKDVQRASTASVGAGSAAAKYDDPF